jgi:shikimate dehydrogenase
MNKDIYVLYGYPLKSSLSPKIHNNSLRNSVYFSQSVKSENLKFAIEAIRVFSWKGANITIPHKVSVMDFLDNISKTAKVIGAVNTIANIDGSLIGYNTDVIGFKASLPKDLDKSRAVVVGAGGAARAIILALIQFGYKRIDVYNRTYSKANEIINYYKRLYNEVEFNSYRLNEMNSSLNGDILVNCTPLENPILDNLLNNLINFECIYDLKYLKDSELLQIGRSLGVKYIINGLQMLILQAAYAQEIWIGEFPDINKIKEILL